MISFIITLIVSYVVGLFGFAQIIGSIQNAKERGAMTIVTIVIWSVILIGLYYVVTHVLAIRALPLIIGYAISFVSLLGKKMV